jgi:hypothetical protein|nr:hypothetical protein [Kofleriaceae bacterium]
MIAAAKLGLAAVGEAPVAAAKPGFKAALAKATKQPVAANTAMAGQAAIAAQPIVAPTVTVTETETETETQLETANVAAPEPETAVQAVIAKAMAAMTALTATATATVPATMPSPSPTTTKTPTTTTTQAKSTDTSDTSVDADDEAVTGKIPLITPMPESVAGQAPASPLERAISDLIETIKPKTEKPALVTTPTPTVAPAAPMLGDKPDAAPVAQVAPIHAAPVAIEAMSHAHLVVGDGDARVVLTVAVRGNDVHVAMRGDDHAVAAMARNVAVLDDSLRHRGLALAELKTTDESADARDAPRERPHREPEADEPEPEEPFSMEEQES